jgi:cytochrome b subunit of formate dehydrogenase
VPGTVERYNRRTRWFHAVVYLAVLVLLGTGWWLLTGQEGRPSVAARWTGLPDTTLHTVAGWVLTGLTAVGLTLGFRAARTFAVETMRADRGDLRWFVRWPVAAFTGRFAHHRGHFDPGQRVANLVIVVMLGVLVVSGVGLIFVVGGPGFVWLQRVHRWATYVVTPVLAGHILIGSGVLPGYRGVARAMHLGGRLRPETAHRIWPDWSNDQQDRGQSDRHGGTRTDAAPTPTHRTPSHRDQPASRRDQPASRRDQPASRRDQT